MQYKSEELARKRPKIKSKSEELARKRSAKRIDLMKYNLSVCMKIGPDRTSGSIFLFLKSNLRCPLYLGRIMLK